MENTEKGTVRVAFAVTMVVLISKLFGFVRETVFASTFGLSDVSDAYNMAYQILTITVLFLTCCTNATFVPMYSRTRLNGGEEKANGFTNSILNLFNILALVISVVGFFAADYIVRLFAPGYGPEKVQLTVQLLRIMFPTLIFYNITNVMSAFLNARGKFLPPQMVGIALNTCVITALLIFSKTHGILAITYATVVSTVLQVLILLPFIIRRFRYRPRIQFRDETVRKTFVLAFPALLGMAINEINFYVDRSVGSYLDTAVTILKNAYILVTFAMGVLIVPVTTILFSKLSAYAAKKDNKRIIGATSQSIEVISIITLPVMLFSIYFAPELIRVIFMRGAFTEASVAVTAPVLMLYMTGLIFYAVRDVLTRTFYAVQDTRTPMLLAAISAVVNGVSDVFFSRLWGVGGIAFATSLSALTGATLLMVFLRRKLGPLGLRGMAKQLIRIVLGCGVALLALLGMQAVFPISSSFLRLFVHGVVGIAVYVVAVVLLGVKEAKLLARVFFDRFRRGRKAKEETGADQKPVSGASDTEQVVSSDSDGDRAGSLTSDAQPELEEEDEMVEPQNEEEASAEETRGSGVDSDANAAEEAEPSERIDE